MCHGVRAAVEVVSEESTYQLRDMQQSSGCWLHYPYNVRVVSLGEKLLISYALNPCCTLPPTFNPVAALGQLSYLVVGRALRCSCLSISFDSIMAGGRSILYMRPTSIAIKQTYLTTLLRFLACWLADRWFGI